MNTRLTRWIIVAAPLADGVETAGVRGAATGYQSSGMVGQTAAG